MSVGLKTLIMAAAAVVANSPHFIPPSHTTSAAAPTPRRFKGQHRVGAPRVPEKYDTETFVCKPERIPLYMHSAARKRAGMVKP